MRQSLSPFRRLWPFFFQAMEHITEETIKSVKSELLDLTGLNTGVNVTSKCGIHHKKRSIWTNPRSSF